MEAHEYSSSTSWIDEAACATHPLAKLHAWDYNITKFRERAISVCNACPVKAECLKTGQTDPSTEGIYGGELFKVRPNRGNHESQSDAMRGL